jgi:flagellar biosynthesis/type III secretory pathway protein FliH
MPWSVSSGTALVFDHTQQQQDDAMRNAPGLTIEAVDRLLREAYVAGNRAGFSKGYENGHKSGRAQGRSEAEANAREHVESVIRGRLNHIERHLRERQEHSKTTIAAEREWAAQQAGELYRAIEALEALS